MASRKIPLNKGQRKLSVQDVRDYSTPQGAAMANEEMRRLALSVEKIQAVVSQPKAEPQKPAAVAKPQPVIIPPSEIWGTTIKHNGNPVQEARNIQVINFVDNADGNITYEITPEPAGVYKTVPRGKGIKVKPTVVIPTPETPFVYNTLWEEAEINEYTINDLGGDELLNGYGTDPEIPKGEKEIVNRDVQQVFRPYPKSNGGNGWVPMKCSEEVHDDTEGYVSHVIDFKYVESPSLWKKDAFVFAPTESGIYKFDVSFFLRAIFLQGIIPSYRMYDSIDRAMLIGEKCTVAESTGDYLYRNPLYWKDVQHGVVENDSTLFIVDELSRYQEVGDNDSGDPQALLYDVIPGYEIAEFAYGNNDSGCGHGVFYNNEVHLGGSIEVFLGEGDAMMFWYKVYGHRSYPDGLGHYARYVPLLCQNVPPTYPPITNDRIMYIHNRYQRIAAHYLGNKETYSEDNRQIVKEMIKLF